MHDNKYLKEDIGRLKADNSDLLKMAKKAEAQRDEAMVSTLSI